MSVAKPENSSASGGDSIHLEPGQFAGRRRYVLRRQLGIGGMGVVWLAHDTRLNTLVALKFLSDELRLDPRAIEELRRETLKSLQLTHPNILRIYDFVEEEAERPFISMEYVAGSTLSAWQMTQRQFLLTWPQIRPIAAQLCDALDYAHSRRVIHRDLKPANVMIDETGCVKLMDFGIAAIAVESMHRITHREHKGTPLYMSPQQTGGFGPQAADDIYSLGATLYELLTSKPPFHTGDIPYQVRHTPPQPINERLSSLKLTNDIPPEVASAIMDCLAKDPANRPQSAQAIKSRLLGTALVEVPIDPGRFPKTEYVSFGTGSTSSRPIVSRPRWAGVAVALTVLAALVGLFSLNRRDSEPEDNGQASPRPIRRTVPMDDGIVFAPESNFKPLFNGTNFSGWANQFSVPWRIDNGVVQVEASEQTRLFHSRDLVNFELRFSWRAGLVPEGSLSFRSFRRDHEELRYRLILTGPRAGTIAMSDQGRFLLSTALGDVTVVDNGEWKILGSTLSHEQRQALIRPNDWNDAALIARSNHFTLFINGERAGEFTDNLRRAALRGGIHFRLMPPPNDSASLQVRDVRMMELPDRILPFVVPPATFAGYRSIPISPLRSETEEGFLPLFERPDLWSTQEKEVWRFNDGQLTGFSPGHDKGASIGLRALARNFEVRFEARVTGKANFRYREQRRIENSSLPYFFMDMSRESPGAAGFLNDDGIQYVDLGSIARLRNSRIDHTAHFRAQDALLRDYKPGDWNEYTIIARDGCFTHYVNGKLFLEIINDTFDPEDQEGRLTFRVAPQVSDTPFKLEVRNARIKHLEEVPQKPL